jgi:hypothetical protein
VAPVLRNRAWLVGSIVNHPDRRRHEMMSQSQECQTNDVSDEWIDSIEHLIRWLAPYTVGRDRVLQRLADVKEARQETHRLYDALCQLSRALDALYPPGAVISLARRRVREVAFAAHP